MNVLAVLSFGMMCQHIPVLAVQQNFIFRHLLLQQWSQAEMNFVRYAGLTQNCLPAGWRTRIINRSNIPLHPDSPSRTHLWQESVKTHLTVKDTDKDQSPYDSWHEIRVPKNRALCWWSASLAVHLPSLMTSLCQSCEMDMGFRMHCGIIGFPCHFCNWASCASSTGFLETHHLFSEVKNGTAIVLNIPVHAGTVLPRGWREPAEQDTTRHGLLVQRQAETNNAAPHLEGIIPSEVWGYLCWVWVYVMSVAIPMCQLVSYYETHTCMSRWEWRCDFDKVIAAVMLIQGLNDLDFSV